MQVGAFESGGYIHVAFLAVLGPQVLEGAVLIVAVPVNGKETADGHLALVVLVRIGAVVPLDAETSQPVPADRLAVRQVPLLTGLLALLVPASSPRLKLRLLVVRWWLLLHVRPPIVLLVTTLLLHLRLRLHLLLLVLLLPPEPLASPCP